MLFAGGVGTLVLGPLADRLGRRPVLLAERRRDRAARPRCSSLVGGVPGAIALALIGVCVVGTFGVTMVMGQEYMPRHIGTASGLVIGLSVGIGGVAAVGLGRLAGHDEPAHGVLRRSRSADGCERARADASVREDGPQAGAGN